MAVTPFAARVRTAVRQIPPGRVATYGDIATLAGRPRAWRAVGSAMATCTDPGVPCHRVIAAGGLIGGYGGDVALKRALLRAEGIVVAGQHIRGFRDVRWVGPARPHRPTVAEPPAPARRHLQHGDLFRADSTREATIDHQVPVSRSGRRSGRS